MEIKRTDDEINEVLNECAERIYEGRSKFPGMSYEEGVEAAIRWLTEDEYDHPMDD